MAKRWKNRILLCGGVPDDPKHPIYNSALRVIVNSLKPRGLTGQNVKLIIRYQAIKENS